MQHGQRPPRFAIATSMWGEAPTPTLTEMLAEVTAAGFDTIEFWPPLCPLISDRMRSNARDTFERSKVRPATMHAPLTSTANPAAVDELARRLAVYEVAAWFAPFADLGGDVVVLHLTCDVFDAGSSNGINVVAAIDAARRSLDELYTIADRLGCASPARTSCLGARRARYALSSSCARSLIPIPQASASAWIPGTPWSTASIPRPKRAPPGTA